LAKACFNCNRGINLNIGILKHLRIIKTDTTVTL
jgi:hypothetical protein